MITLIAATDKNDLIGNNGKLPWKIPEDMEFFKRVTTNNIVVMGRKTYISIGSPLKNRVNVILSSSILENFDKDRTIESYSNDVIVVNSFGDLKMFSDRNVFIIGGRSIYKQTFDLGLADKLLISRINDEFEGNEHLPEIPKEYKVSQVIKLSDKVSVWEYRR